MNKIAADTHGNYFNHDADIGIIGRGETIETCFADTAKTMFSLMANLSAVNVIQIINFEFEEADNELALVKWLNLLLTKSQEHHLIFKDFRLKREENIWKATVSGDTWQQAIAGGVKVKSARKKMLSVKKINHLWEARIVIDV